jgi:hypothetical protein
MTLVSNTSVLPKRIVFRVYFLDWTSHQGQMVEITMKFIDFFKSLKNIFLGVDVQIPK